MAVPLWMQIVYGPKVAPQGPRSRTPRTAIVNTPLSARGARGSGRSTGGRSKTQYADGPEGVIARLKDYGLSDDQVSQVIDNDDTDSFDVASPSDWLSKGGDVLGGVLDTLDMPRAALLAGATEGAEGLRQIINKLPGPNIDPLETTDRVRETGFSWADAVENFNNRVGFADLLEADAPTAEGGLSSPLARTGIGLAMDIATDPLNYLGVGLVDEPKYIAQLFRNDDVIAALGREAADKAAEDVLQRGVTSLGKKELAAIKREGGLYMKVPGTGPIGRLTGVDKAIGKLTGSKLSRTATIAGRGTRLGDLASEAAQATRRYTGLNSLLRHVGGGAATKGLAGSLGPLTAAYRGANDIAKPLDALLVTTRAAEGRSVAKALERQLSKKWKTLSALARGVDGRELMAAVGGTQNEIAASHPELVAGFRQFFDEARVQANTLAGRDFIPEQPNYVPRVMTDEARTKFGLGGVQARGKGGVQSIARGREYVPGETFKIGNNEYQLVDPLESGLSVEDQIRDALENEGMTQWFKDDLFDLGPSYIHRIGRQLQDEYVGQKLIGLDVAQDLWRPDYTKPFKAAGDRPKGGPWQKVDKIETDLRNVETIVEAFGRESEEAQSLPWEELWDKARSSGASWEPQTYPALNDIFRETGVEMAQFGTGAALPKDIVGVLRDAGKMAEPGAFPRVINLHHRLMKGWKKLALLTPGYHWRNSMGGVWMNWVGDVDEGRYLQLERLISRDMSPEREAFFGRRTLTAPLTGVDDEMLLEGFEEAKKLGIFTGGQSFKEVENVREQLPSPIRFSRRMGAAIENRLRGAMFLDEYVKTGGDSSAAFQKTMKYHFDYDDLGKTEESLRTWGIPFYTFTRKSIPVMLEMVVRNPGKINRYFQLKNSIERLSQEEGIVPEYFTRNFAIRLPWAYQGSQVYLSPDLPLMSLVDASDSNQAMGQISPFIKLPYEYNAEKQVWKGIPLEQDPTEVPAYLSWMKPALRATGHLYTDVNGREVMSGKDYYVLNSMVPQIGQARRLFPSEDRYKERRLTSMLSWALGIGAKANTDREQANELWRRYDPYADEMDQLDTLGYGSDAGFSEDDRRDMAFAS